MKPFLKNRILLILSIFQLKKNYLVVRAIHSSCYSILTLEVFKETLITEFLDNLDFEFKVICISETWCSENVSCNSLYKIPNYNSIHHIRGNGKAGT